MKKNFYDIKTKKLSYWEPLIKSWVSLVRRYCNFMEDDAPYYYNERANIGILAGAAWLVNWISLEEFSSRKRGKKQAWCDLYLYPKNQNRGEYIEAKQVWNINQASQKLDEALKNARDILVHKSEGAIKIGMIFVCHEFHEKYYKGIDKRIDGLIETASRIPCDVFAWSFPGIMRGLRGGGDYSKTIYPGVILLAKVVE